MKLEVLLCVCVCDLLRQWRLVRTVLGVLCVHYHSLLRDRDLGSSKQKSLPVSFSRRVQCPGPATFSLSLFALCFALFSSLSRAPPPLSLHRSINLHSLVNYIRFHTILLTAYNVRERIHTSATQLGE